MAKHLFIMRVLIAFSVLIPLSLKAQNAPQFLLTWQAENFAPGSYEGRMIPTRNTQIRVALEELQNGKLLDLSAQDIHWFVGNELYQSGRGIHNFSFAIPSTAAVEETVRAVLVQGTGEREARAVIPVADPEVVIDAPYPGATVSPTLGSLTLSAIPYSFNVSRLTDLSFSWAVNGVSAEGVVADPHLATLSLSGAQTGDAIAITARASNPAQPLESVSGKVIVTVQ
jgi:hypothetical protein